MFRVNLGGRRAGPVGCLVAAVVIVLSLGCTLAIFFMVFNMLRSSDVVTVAVARVEADRRATAMLGAPIEVGWLVSGSLNTDTVGSGYADLNVPVSGPKGRGRLRLTANQSGGEWEFSSLTLTVSDTGETIDLLGP